MQISLDKIVAHLKDTFDIAAYVEQTGGGTATIYAGPTQDEPGWGDRYAAVAGPGWFNGPGRTEGTGDSRYFFIGPDDDGSAEATILADFVTPTTTAHAAETIAAACIYVQVTATLLARG